MHFVNDENEFGHTLLSKTFEKHFLIIDIQFDRHGFVKFWAVYYKHLSWQASLLETLEAYEFIETLWFNNPRLFDLPYYVQSMTCIFLLIKIHFDRLDCVCKSHYSAIKVSSTDLAHCFKNTKINFKMLNTNF